MDESELKQMIEASAAETRRHFDTVAARVETKIQLVADGVLGNTERIRGFDTRVGSLETTISQLDVKVSKIHSKLDRLASELGERIERLEHSTN